MCLTLRGVARALRDIGGERAPAPLALPYVAETMAQASVRVAQPAGASMEAP